MTALATWLLEQIAADEQAARECPRQEWTVHGPPGGQVSLDGYDGAQPSGYRVGGGPMQYGVSHSFSMLATQVKTHDPNATALRHAARWDPKRALAECAAKRRIIAEHPVYTDLDWQECRTCLDKFDKHEGPLMKRWPCRTLRALALPYADRPGYLAEWAP